MLHPFDLAYCLGMAAVLAFLLNAAIEVWLDHLEATD